MTVVDTRLRARYASGMTKLLLLAAASTAAFALASPASARPMTATDMHMMHRVGAPEVSADGNWAVFTISTDWPQDGRRPQQWRCRRCLLFGRPASTSEIRPRHLQAVRDG